MIYTIYKITNSLNGKVYVGSTKDPHSRWNDHKSSLRRGTNSSRRLQADWDICGEDCFAFEVLEETDEADRFTREQYYMDLYRSYDEGKGYNISPTAENCTGRRHTEAARRKMSVSHTGKTLSEESRRKQSEAMKQYVFTEEHRRHISEANKGREAPWARGSSNYNAKLTEELVAQIKLRLFRGEKGLSIARDLGLRHEQVYAIKNGRIWRHVQVPKEDGDSSCPA